MYPIPFYDRLIIASLIDELWPRVEVLDGDTDLFPAIRCMVTPGHQAIYLYTRSGVTIIAGDSA